MKKQIIYHSNCPDGFCAAWLCHFVWPDAEFIPANYGWKEPDVTGNDVLIVDFSYSKEKILEMKEKAAVLMVLDHHETARKALEDLPFCRFDNSKCGTRLVWDYLTSMGLLDPAKLPRSPLWLIDYIEDHDLHLGKLPDSEAICAAIHNVDYDFDKYSELSKQYPISLIREGNALLVYKRRMIEHHVKYAQDIDIMGVKGKGIQCSVNKLGSRICDELLKLYPEAEFAASWQDTIDGTRIYSLRGRQGGFDVGELAESLGGGGHRSASSIKIGFQTVLFGPVKHSKPEQPPKPGDTRTGSEPGTAGSASAAGTC